MVFSWFLTALYNLPVRSLYARFVVFMSQIARKSFIISIKSEKELLLWNNFCTFATQIYVRM